MTERRPDQLLQTTGQVVFLLKSHVLRAAPPRASPWVPAAPALGGSWGRRAGSGVSSAQTPCAEGWGGSAHTCKLVSGSLRAGGGLARKLAARRASPLLGTQRARPQQKRWGSWNFTNHRSQSLSRGNKYVQRGEPPCSRAVLLPTHTCCPGGPQAGWPPSSWRTSARGRPEGTRGPSGGTGDVEGTPKSEAPGDQPRPHRR